MKNITHDTRKNHTGNTVDLDAHRSPENLAAVIQRRFRLSFHEGVARVALATDHMTTSTTRWAFVPPPSAHALIVTPETTVGPRAMGRLIAFSLSTVAPVHRQQRLDALHRTAPHGWSLVAARQTLASIAECEESA